MSNIVVYLKNIEFEKKNLNLISIKPMETELDLETIYSMLDCDTIEIPRRKFNGVVYNIICDGEFLLKSDPKPTLISEDGREVLCGNLIICPINKTIPCEMGSFKTLKEAEKFVSELKRNPRYNF